MCGIAAGVRFDGGVADDGAGAATCEQLAPRGPGGSRVGQSGPVALGHRRLEIIDLTDAGAQPLVDLEPGLTCVVDGIGYDDQELREDLYAAGYRSGSTSDTEVVLEAHHAGAACVEKSFGLLVVVGAHGDRDTHVSVAETVPAHQALTVRDARGAAAARRGPPGRGPG